MIRKISPVGDWRSTSLEWPWPWPCFRPYSIPSCITHRPLSTYRISWSSEENFFWNSPLRFWSSSESRDTNSTRNIINPAPSILILCSSFRICGHLPASILNGGGDRFWKWKSGFYVSWNVSQTCEYLGKVHMSHSQKTHLQLFAKRMIATLGQREIS